MSGMTPLGIDNVLFAVTDLPAAVEFYRDRIGLPLAFQLDQAVEVADPSGNVIGFTDYTTMPERGRHRPAGSD